MAKPLRNFIKILYELKKINPDRIVSISAIIVSVGTLLLILYQTNLIQKHQKASVMPSLFIGYGVSGEDDIKETIWVSNQGLGPAFIENVNIIHEGEIYNTDPYGYISTIESNDKSTYINRLNSGRIIPANEGITIYEKITDSTSKIVISNFFAFSYEIDRMPTHNINKAVIEIVYKNVYGDKWKIRSNQTTPTEID